MAVVYWLHLPNHTDFLTQGYIGVSTKFHRRLYEHKYLANSGKHINPYLSNVINKHGNHLIQTILLKGEEDYCYFIEERLRPTIRIGWNIAKGGFKPPSQLGKKFSEKHKINMRKPKPSGFGESISGNNNPNWGKGAALGTKWFYDPISKVSKYYVPGDQPDSWVVGRYSRKRI